MVTQKQINEIDLLAKTLETFKPNFQPITEVIINDKYENSSCGVLSIKDLHFGKEDNFTITEDFKNAVRDLVMRAYASHRLEKIIYVVGGDLLNMDSFDGKTTKGTPVDNEVKAQEAYTQAFDALHWSISFIKNFSETLEVVYVPGNHDRLSSYHIAHSLSKCFNGLRLLSLIRGTRVKWLPTDTLLSIVRSLSWRTSRLVRQSQPPSR